MCGDSLIGRGSREDVFPLWLQQRERLLSQSIYLPNGTWIPYRQLKVPCCKDCNNGPMSQLERAIRDAFDGGVVGVRSLDPDDLFRWCCKIIYGVLYKAAHLPFDRKQRDQSTIVPKDWLAYQSNLRMNGSDNS